MSATFGAGRIDRSPGWLATRDRPCLLEAGDDQLRRGVDDKGGGAKWCGGTSVGYYVVEARGAWPSR